MKAALTLADTACQEALLVPLARHFPDVGLEAEEDTPTVRRFGDGGDSVVVIDPIDGTLRFYLEGRGPYSVIIGLAVAREYQAALVALPREGLQFHAVRGAGAEADSAEDGPGPASVSEGGRRILASHDLPEAAVSLLQERGYAVEPASGGAISVAPLVPGVCAGLRLVRHQALGVSIRGRIGALIAEEAGALVRGADGRPFTRTMDEPAPALLTALDEAVMADLQDAVAVAGTRETGG